MSTIKIPSSKIQLKIPRNKKGFSLKGKRSAAVPIIEITIIGKNLCGKHVINSRVFGLAQKILDVIVLTGPLQYGSEKKNK